MEKIMRPWRDLMIIALFLCPVLGFGIGFGIEAATQTAANDSAKFPAAAGAGDLRARFTGTYLYAGSAQEEGARNAAIDHAVEGLSFVTRSTARNRVSATTQILGFYNFSFEPGKIVVRPEARPEMVSRDTGEPTDYVYNRKHSTLTQVLAGDRITQVFVSDDGRRQNEFTLSQDGRVLTIKVTLSSARLSSPVVYSLSYKRAD
jgi:hypothetical protein